MTDSHRLEGNGAAAEFGSDELIDRTEEAGGQNQRDNCLHIELSREFNSLAKTKHPTKELAATGDSSHLKEGVSGENNGY